MTKFFSGLMPIAGAFWRFEFLRFVPSDHRSICIDCEVRSWSGHRVARCTHGSICDLSALYDRKASSCALPGQEEPGLRVWGGGIAGGVVIWVYYSAQIFYFGAELTHTIALAREKEEQDHNLRTDVAA